MFYLTPKEGQVSALFQVSLIFTDDKNSSVLRPLHLPVVEVNVTSHYLIEFSNSSNHLNALVFRY